MIHPEDLALSQDLMKKHLENPEVPFDLVVRYFHKNKSIVWVRCKGIAIRDTFGKPIRMLGVHLILSASFLRQFQTDEEEIGKDELFLKDSNFSSSKEGTNETCTENKFFGHLYESDVKDVNIEAFFKEVSERVELTNQIRSKNEFLETLINNIEDSVLIFNEQLQLIFSNKQFEKIIGYKIEKYPLDFIECLNFIHPDHIDFVFNTYNNARLNKEKNITEQHKANNADGKLIWLEDHVTFEYDSDLNYKRAYIVSRDITERKLIEISLEQESFKRKEIAEMLVEERELGKEQLYINLKESVESILIDSKNDLEVSGHLNNKYIQVAYQHLVSALEEVQKIVLESSSQFIFEGDFVVGVANYFNMINSSSKVLFEVQNQLAMPIDITESKKKHLFRICQELAQNASKHTNATKMRFRFKQENGKLILIVKDNGEGIGDFKITGGIGIKNIFNRVYLMNGTIRFFYFRKTGLAIYISLDTNNN